MITHQNFTSELMHPRCDEMAIVGQTKRVALRYCNTMEAVSRILRLYYNPGVGMILIKDQSFLEKSQKYPHDLGAEKKTLNVIRIKVSEIAYRDNSEFPT